MRQSGDGVAVHGRITKAGRSQARAMLVEAAYWPPAPAFAAFIVIVGDLFRALFA